MVGRMLAPQRARARRTGDPTAQRIGLWRANPGARYAAFGLALVGGPGTKQRAADRGKRHGDVSLALRLTLVYAVLATLWILLSDRAIGWVHPTGEFALRVASIRGTAFAVVTSVLLFLLALGYARRLRRSEERYANLFSHAVEGLVVLRVPRDGGGQVVDLEIVDVNQTQEARTGRPRQEIVGTRMSQAGGLDERSRRYLEVWRPAPSTKAGRDAPSQICPARTRTNCSRHTRSATARG